jgi:hypothetical protein
MAVSGIAAGVALSDSTFFPLTAMESDTVEGGVLRGVGNNIGVTATTSAVRRRAIESLLSIYGTGSYPPALKG